MLWDLLKVSGVVPWICMVMGVMAFVVFVERSLHLHRARIRTEDFLKGVFNILAKQNVPEALTICEETPGPVAYLLKTAILHREESRESIRNAMDEASLGEISRMERRLVVISVVAQLAPLMGLLGTVLGLVELLLVLHQEAPLIQSADLTGGLLRALVSTAAGLMVAIPCYAAFNLLVIKIDRIVLDMDRAKSEVIAFFSGLGRGEATGK
jgi:biopolymer transport protein ExbB